MTAIIADTGTDTSGYYSILRVIYELPLFQTLASPRTGIGLVVGDHPVDCTRLPGPGTVSTTTTLCRTTGWSTIPFIPTAF